MLGLAATWQFEVVSEHMRVRVSLGIGDFGARLVERSL
jgi:hypothetical protein